MSSEPGTVLGYDFGTSSVKAGLFDRDGRITASSSAPYPLALPGDGLAEQNPLDWWQAMARATRVILDAPGVRRESIAGIGLAAQMCGTVPVDAAGVPLHPCLIWLDTRSAGIARRITGGGPRIAGYGLLALLRWLPATNGVPNLSGNDPLSKMLWFRESQPEIWRRCAKFLDVKDWLLHRCTGRFATTADAAQLTWLMDNRPGRQRWSESLAQRVGIALERLPEIVGAGETAGALTADAAAHLGLRAGLPVSGGAGDLNAFALASGAQRIGAQHLCVGTSLWFSAYVPGRKVDPFSGIATLCAAQRDRYLLVATQECAGSAVQWSAAALGFGEGSQAVAALDAAAARARPGEQTPLFFPWLHGERVPVDDRHLRGGFSGASLASGRDDLAYATLAGVALNARWALERMNRLAPPAQAAISFMGGGARSAAWGQVFADILQRPLRVPAAPHLAGARGAAMTAALAAGWHADFAHAFPGTAFEREHEPDPGRRAWSEDHYARFVGFHRATRAWYRAAAAAR